MPARAFRLTPFAPAQAPFGLRLDGRLACGPGRLRVDYRLTGPLRRLAIPPPSDRPTRRDRLWRNTCFELFLAPTGGKRYWELNLSPAGHWNLYRFDGYRSGMQAETALSAPALSVRHQPHNNRFELSVRLRSPLTDLLGGSLDLGISAVIVDRTGKTSYWALHHPSTRPDFHRRGALVECCRLPPAVTPAAIP